MKLERLTEQNPERITGKSEVMFEGEQPGCGRFM